MTNENENFLKPGDYIKIVFRRKWLMIVPVFIGLITGIVAGHLMPKSYQAETTILVEEEKVINPLIEGLAIATSVADRLQSIQEQILSWKTLVKLSLKLNLIQVDTDEKELKRLVARLRSNMFVGMKGFNVITVAFQSQAPEETKKVVDALTDLFIQENIERQTKETEIAVKFIKEQLGVYRRKIKEAEIAGLQEQLDILLVDATDKHPQVRDLKQQIAKAKEELDSEEYDITQGSIKQIPDPVQKKIQAELEKIEQEERRKAGFVAEAEASTSTVNQSSQLSNLYKVLLMDKLDKVKARDAGVNEGIYYKLLERLESARITQRLETSKEGTRYMVLNPAQVPTKPIKPNKLLIMVMGMFIGSVSGVGLVLGAEVMDNSILDIDEAKRVLDLPILGAISKIATQEEIDKEKARNKITIRAVLAIGLSIALAAVVYSLFRHP